MVVVLLTIWVFPYTLIGQNWNEINPGGVEILEDTTLLRSVIVTLEPGQSMGPVTHPANFAYVLSGGKLKVIFDGGEPVVMDLEEGNHLYNNREGPNEVSNIGKTAVSFLLVELKEHPYKKNRKD